MINSVRPFRIELFLFCGAIALHQWAVSKYGLAIFPDSVNYIHASRSFLESFEFKQFTGEWFVSWPPLYSLILTLHFPNSDWFYTISSLSHGIISAISSIVLFRLFHVIRDTTNTTGNSNTIFQHFLFSLLSLSAWPLFQLSFEFVSEVYFIACILLGFYLGVAREKWVIGLIFFCLASLQRYVGLFWLISYLFMTYATISSKKKWLFYSFLSLLPLSAWLIRNWLITGTFTGERSNSFISFYANFLLGFDSLSKWFFPHFIPQRIRFILVTLLLGITIFYSIQGIKAETKTSPLPIKAALFALQHLVFMWIVSTLGKSESLSFRMLAPSYPFVLTWLIGTYANHRSTVTTLLKMVLFCVALWQIVFLLRYSNAKATYGAGGFTSDDWIQSDWYQWKRSNSLQQPIGYSNAPDAFYALFEEKIKSTPFRSEWRTAKQQELFQDSLLVWISLMNRKTLVPLDSLVKQFNLTLEYQGTDFSVWRKKTIPENRTKQSL